MDPIPLGMQSEDAGDPNGSGSQEFPSTFIDNAPDLPDEGTITFSYKKVTASEEASEGEADDSSTPSGGVEIEFTQILDVQPAQSEAPSDDSPDAAFEKVAKQVRGKRVAPPRDDSDEMPA